MRYEVTHATTYDYSDSVSVSHHVARLTPRALPGQHVLHHEIAIDPEPAVTSAHEDYFGNIVTSFGMQGPHQRLSVVARSVVETAATAVPDDTPAWDAVCAATKDEIEACEFVFDSPRVRAGTEYAEYAAPSFKPRRPLLEAVADLTARIHEDLTYEPGATSVATTLDEVFRKRRGVCQDFAHFEIACLRAVGLAARYVSGYLETAPPPNRPRLVGADASHAWVAVYCPGSGWIDLDPTNNLAPASGHITLAWGRDYGDVSPIRGVILGGGDHKWRVAVDVVRSAAAPQP